MDVVVFIRLRGVVADFVRTSADGEDAKEASDAGGGESLRSHLGWQTRESASRDAGVDTVFVDFQIKTRFTLP